MLSFLGSSSSPNTPSNKRREEFREFDPHLVHKQIEHDQWEVICSRLDLPDFDDAHHHGSTTSQRSSVCTGVISLAFCSAHSKEPIHIPLVSSNIKRLEAIGFKISEDKLWAIYHEPEQKEEEEEEDSNDYYMGLYGNR